MDEYCPGMARYYGAVVMAKRTGWLASVELGACCNRPIPGEIERYTGNLYSSATPEVTRAYQSWVDQVRRCYSPENRAHRYYGAKGVRVSYSARDFISWYLHTLPSFDGVSPSIDRIDGTGHYCFCNIRLIEKRTNALQGLTVANVRLKLSRL